VTSLLGRLLIAGDAVALSLDGFTSEQNIEIGAALEALEIPASAEQALLEEVARDQENLAGVLTVRG
jgi:hypothetical protein